MKYRVRIAPTAQTQIDQFAVYLREYSEDFATEQIDRLERTLQFILAESPRRSAVWHESCQNS